MTKQNHLIQIERYKVRLKCLLAMAISLSLITAFLIVPQLAYAAYISALDLSGTTATLIGDGAADTIIIDVSSGNLRHNRFTAGDPGFFSNLDWDTTVAGDQILLNVPGVTVNINPGLGDDQIILGTTFNPASLLVVSFNINDDSGTDSVTLDETAESGANTFTITPNSIQSGSAVINYNTTVENLIVNAGGVSTENLVITGTLGLAVNTYSVTSSSIQRSGVATITYNTAVDNLLLNGGSTADIFNLLSIGIPTTLNGDAGGDTFAFADGVTLLGGTIEGGAGPDKLEYIAYTTPVTVNLTSNTATGTAVISSIKDVTGGLGNDTLTGNSSANDINGGPGNDVLNGMFGIDSLVGGPDNDTYNFSPGWGVDTIVEAAGAGSDSMNFSAIITQPLTITINSVNVTYGLNTATHSGNDVESVISGSGDDTFHVNASALSSHSISIDGGPHPTGDVLNFNAAGHSVITNTTTITAEGQQPLFYSQIEQVNIISTLPIFLPIILK